MSDPELCFLSVTELASLLRSRKVSSVEVVEALLARIDAVDTGMRAYVHVCREQALAAARAAEIEIGAGLDRGPLHGIPVAYKVLRRARPADDGGLAAPFGERGLPRTPRWRRGCDRRGPSAWGS